jgi:plastocyanin
MRRFILLAALFLGTASATLAADHRVTVSDTEFTPRRINAVVGDTITWILQPGATGHIVASVTIPQGAEPWDQPVNAENPRFRTQVTVPGVYQYHCRIHLFMKGSIKVSP